LGPGAATNQRFAEAKRTPSASTTTRDGAASAYLRQSL
jgi:hypothetical protein